jgi:Sec-independent protein secretion pathway component TatC
VPLYLLFEVGVLLATLAERRAAARARRIEATLADEPLQS